jgi:hypothetical protein
MSRVERTPEARIDLRQIAWHIAQDNPSAAIHWLDAMDRFSRRWQIIRGWANACELGASASCDVFPSELM